MAHTAHLAGRARAARRRAGRWLCRLRPTATAAGQGLVEYALILVLIAIVVIGILTQLGGQTSRVYQQIACTLDGGSLHEDSGNNNSQRCR